MTTKLLSLAGFAMLLFSCSDGDETFTPPINNQEAVFDYYTVQSTTSYESGLPYEIFTTAHLEDQKLFSETVTTIESGVMMQPVTTQRYFYQNGKLVKRAYDNDIRNFFYDAQGNLVALNWNRPGFGAQYYYRFVNVSQSKAYFERLSLPYDDPATEAFKRYVLEFDSNDNVVKAGNDGDFDGNADMPHTFDYNADDDLIAIHSNTGITTTIDYSPIKDNFFKLLLNSMGRKRDVMLYQAECYAALLEPIKLSPHLRLSDTQEALFEVQESPYYFKSTKTETLGDGENTTVTTFYFE